MLSICPSIVQSNRGFKHWIFWRIDREGLGFGDQCFGTKREKGYGILGVVGG
jgi:hypothetical protein